MKITLIQIDMVLGSRVLLKLLCDKGYEVTSLQINIRYSDQLSEVDHDMIYNRVKDSDVVGIAFNSFYASQAEGLCRQLKKKGIPWIIAGGSHATAFPDEVAQWVDIVVLFEAEITLPRVLCAISGHSSLEMIGGIRFRIGSEIFSNGLPPEIEWDLDKIPIQSADIQLIRYFEPRRGFYTPEQTELFRTFGKPYFLLASRGCPFSCTYCSNSVYHSIDASFRKVRKRSIQNIIMEMEQAAELGFKAFYIVDDHFFSFTVDEIRKFSEIYMDRVGKPFSVLGINPNTFRSPHSEEKLKLLLNSGLTDIRVGIQSGSNKTLEYFDRKYRAEELKDLLAPIDRNRKTIWPPPFDKLHVSLDFICDAVWEDNHDKIDTIRLAQNLLKQYSIFFYTLVYLPGTDLYHMAKKNGWISDELKDIYLKGIAGVEDNIFNRILFMVAVAKERAVDIPDNFMDHLLNTAVKEPETAKILLDTIIECINGVELHHAVNRDHAALYPYLTGFNTWTKRVGDVGQKVLFRSYHEAYG